MPIVKYTLRVLDDVFSETDTFPPSNDPDKLIANQIVQPLQKRREALKEPPIELAGVEILNRYIHQHVWEAGRVDKFAMKVHYHCKNCHVTGYRRFHMFKGEYGPIMRDRQYQVDRFALCKDKLNPMPKMLVFIRRSRGQ